MKSFTFGICKVRQKQSSLNAQKLEAKTQLSQASPWVCVHPALILKQTSAPELQHTTALEQTLDTTQEAGSLLPVFALPAGLL